MSTNRLCLAEAGEDRASDLVASLRQLIRDMHSTSKSSGNAKTMPLSERKAQVEEHLMALQEIAEHVVRCNPPCPLCPHLTITIVTCDEDQKHLNLCC